MTASRGGYVETAPQHLRGQVRAQQIPRPAEQVDGDERLAADRVHVGEGVRSRDLAEGVGVIDHRGEEISGSDDRAGLADPDDGRVIAVLDADQDVGGPPWRDEPGDSFLEFARRDLAGATAAMGVLSEPDALATGHVLCPVMAKL